MTGPTPHPPAAISPVRSAARSGVIGRVVWGALFVAALVARYSEQPRPPNQFTPGLQPGMPEFSVRTPTRLPDLPPGGAKGGLLGSIRHEPLVAPPAEARAAVGAPAEPAPPPPPAAADWPEMAGFLDSIIPRTVGDFTLQSVDRQPALSNWIDEGVTDAVVMVYESGRGERVVHALGSTVTTEQAKVVRDDIVKGASGGADSTVVPGLTMAADGRQAEVFETFTTGGKCLTWVAGRVAAHVCSLTPAAADGFARAVPYWRGGQIIWKTNLSLAYRRALAESLPLAVYFQRPTGASSAQLEREVLGANALDEWAGQAVFARVDVTKDDEHKNVSTMLESLKVNDVPTLVLLDPYPDVIRERDRIVGFYELAEYRNRAAALFEKPAVPHSPKP